MIRPMEKTDASRVTEIHVFGWRCAYRGIVPDDVLFEKMQVYPRIEKTTAWIDGEDAFGETYVYDDDTIKAFLTIGLCRDEDKPKTFELGGLYVDPCFQGEGIGTKLVVFCEKIAEERGYDEICLWTFEKNVSTRAFYEKLGYIADGKTMLVGSYEAVGVRYGKKLNHHRP